MGVGQVAADGGEVFFCYSSGGLRNSGDAAADAELAAWQAEHEGAPVAHIDVCRADGSGRRRLVEFPALEDSEAGTLQMWAADDRSLYVTVRLTNDPADSGDDTRALYAVDRRSGACTELAPNVDTPVFVSGRGLYLFEYELEGEGTADVRDKGVQVRRLDADTCAWSDGVHHENSWGPASPQGLSSGGCYLTAAGGDARSLLRADTMNGTLEVLDPDSGETLATVTGLPAAAEGTHVDWQCRELENWYAVQSFELPWGGSEGVERLFLAPRTGGAAQEVKLYQYVSARGADPIYLYDEWNGRLFCHAAYRETPATMLGKDGVPYATSDIEDIYALLPVESALAGADDYTYFTNWPGLAR